MNRIVLLFVIGILSLSSSYSQNIPYALYSTDTIPNLIPPSGFTASADSNLVTLSWNIPYDSDVGQVPFNLVGFNIYRNDSILLSCGNQSNTVTLTSYNGAQVYSITGVYDLTPYGLPGTTGESEIVFADTLEVAYGFAFPFFEDWNSGSMNTQFWNAENGWNITGQYGYPSPSVCFDGSPGFTQYSRSLESFWINAAAITTTSPHSIHLDFDLKLLDQSVTQGTESLSVEVWNGTAWSQAASFVNQGTMIQWEHQSLDISYWSKKRAFKIRFRVSGVHSSPIIWWIDNIQVTWQLHLNPPTNLNAMLMGVPFNDAHLTWERPTGFNDIIHYVLDDNSAENAWAISNGYDAWLGNEFNVTESGGIVSVDVYWQAEPGSGDEPLTIDIFNSNLELVGSSEPFIPVWGYWQNIQLPNIPFSGTFRAMVHWNLLAGNSGYMGSDENGPYVHLDPEWYYDGISWAKLTDFGYSPSVFMLRVHALLNYKKNEIILLPGPGSELNRNNHHDSITNFPHSNSASITHNPFGLLGFNIYHLWVFSVPGFTDTIIPWTMFATVPPSVNEYIEYNLAGSGRVYYRVTAVYDEGESEPSNYDWVGFSGKEDPDRIGITVLPNPAGDYLTFELHRIVGVLRLYDPFGRLILQRDVSGKEQYTLDTSGLPGGIYLVKLQLSDGLVQMKKIVIAH